LDYCCFVLTVRGDNSSSEKAGKKRDETERGKESQSFFVVVRHQAILAPLKASKRKEHTVQPKSAFCQSTHFLLKVSLAKIETKIYGQIKKHSAMKRAFQSLSP